MLSAVSLSLAMAIVVLAQAPDSPAPRVTFTSSVDLVPIGVVVRDRRGGPITSLGASDFEVLDNGEPARIVHMTGDRENAVSVALLLDTSGSMRMGPRLPLADAAVDRLVSELHEGRDEVALFTFDNQIQERQAFTTHPSTLAPASKGIQAFGTTSIYDAIASTARRMSDRPSARRAIVVFTDGFDTSSALKPADVSAIASSIDVPVYVIGTVTPTDREQYLERLDQSGARAVTELQQLAQWTGGDLFFASSPEEALLTARQILAGLRHEYILAIEASPEAEWRRIEVRVPNRSFTVRTRSGYFGRNAVLAR
jgi:VWFA-related protein